jgi:hypothetical protein
MTVGLLAQAKPNFSGKWAIDQEKTTAANPAPAGGGGGAAGGGGGRGGAGGGGARGGGGGGAFELKQDATSLTRITEGQNGPMEQKYVLDGQAHDMPMGQATAKVTAKIDGATIVIETTRDNNGTPSTSKAVYSMEGDYLVIANTNPGRNGGEPTTRKSFYKKG